MNPAGPDAGRRILNFGSLNIDHVYGVDHFVRPGETLGSRSYRQFAGGKGANQSIALAFAGAAVWHAGKLGADGTWLKDRLARSGVDTTFVEIVDGSSGHAIIQVDSHGENAIVLHGGANRAITGDDAARVLANFAAGDYLLLQNEISAIPAILREARTRGLKVAFNPAPMTREVLDYPLDCVDIFIVNEIEGRELAGETEPGRILTAMRERHPAAATVLTLGAEGAVCGFGDRTYRVPAPRVQAVDTTAAGDTFIGYFLAALLEGRGVEDALRMACRAAAVCVTRHGAADSIPKRHELG